MANGLLHSAFVSLPGSLIHPIAMLCIASGWVLTWVIGLGVRRERKNQLRGNEGTRLLGDDRAAGLWSGRSHHKLSAGLLFATVLFMLTGMANTFSRTGRLFPGPHLYGGLGLILAVTANVALAPWLREKVQLRTLHTAIGGIVILLVASQIYSGLGILSSLIQGFLQ